MSKYFDKWWAEEGELFNPDPDKPWLDKRKDLAELAYKSGAAQMISRKKGDTDGPA